VWSSGFLNKEEEVVNRRYTADTVSRFVASELGGLEFAAKGKERAK
jgi:hypothetical protein